MTDMTKIREGIVEAIPYETSNYGESPDRRSVYIPLAHVKALRIESNLVVGSRGVGKSFWTAALDTPAVREILGDSIRDLVNTRVGVGFAVKENIDAYPNTEVFADLLKVGYTPYEIWQAVVLRWLTTILDERRLREDWRTTTAWVRANPEPFAKFMQRAHSMFQAKSEKGLLVFDALDRSSNDWMTMDRIVRDLLRVVLWLKSFPTIHAKVFLREDQFGRTVTDFPDASKLLATKSELDWQPHDLHGLLWQLLCNAPGSHGAVFRDIYERIVGMAPARRGNAWGLAEEVKREGEKQRAMFESLAGPWMGRDRRRGVPYVWSVSHLADGKGRTSPRSFLAAVRAAAEDSMVKYPGHTWALHYESIKRGVQKASEIRISEIAEDYPWVKMLFDPLKGVTVPCDFCLVEDRWNRRFPAGLSSLVHDGLPPRHVERGWSGVREDIERLGLFETMKDGRINMPDLYRVGFGMGRRGGVKPMSRG